MSFADAVVSSNNSQKTTTTNGMPCRVTSANKCVDLFYKIGSSRGQDITSNFVDAYHENPELALRILLWSRDIRGGAGERQQYRNLLLFIEQNTGITFKRDELYSLINKTPLIGRWDDLFHFKELMTKDFVFGLVESGLNDGNGLLAKWLPREKSANKQFATELMGYMNLSARQYRKLLVKLTSVVESKMCAGQWDDINFSHVPSKAATIYKKAFNRHTTKYAEYVESLVNGEAGVKVNAGAIFPHDVIKELITSINCYDMNMPNSTELKLMQEQWNALPDYMDGQNIMPIVDTSGSMTWDSAKIKGTSNLYAYHVAQALGLYCADKNKGAFKDIVMQFNSDSKIEKLSGGIVEKIRKLSSIPVGGSTNIQGAIENILKLGIKNSLPNEDMPKVILIFSDMQFNESYGSHNKFDVKSTSYKLIKKGFKDAGYDVPRVVYWNLAGDNYDNVPVKFDKNNTAMVSGYSPALLKSILKGSYESFTSLNVMLETVMIPRYDLT